MSSRADESSRRSNERRYEQDDRGSRRNDSYRSERGASAAAAAPRERERDGRSSRDAVGDERRRDDRDSREGYNSGRRDHANSRRRSRSRSRSPARRRAREEEGERSPSSRDRRSDANGGSKRRRMDEDRDSHRHRRDSSPPRRASPPPSNPSRAQTPPRPSTTSDPYALLPRHRSPSPAADPAYYYRLPLPSSLFPLVKGPNGARSRQLTAFAHLLRLTFVQANATTGAAAFAQLVGSREGIAECVEKIKAVLGREVDGMNGEQKKDFEGVGTWCCVVESEVGELGESKAAFEDRAQVLARQREEKAKATASIRETVMEDALKEDVKPEPQREGRAEAAVRSEAYRDARQLPQRDADNRAPLSHQDARNRPSTSRLPPWAPELRQSGLLKDMMVRRGTPPFCIVIPPEFAGIVMGRGAAGVKALESSSGASHVFLDAKGRPAVLYIWGNAEKSRSVLKTAEERVLDVRFKGAREDSWKGALEACTATAADDLRSRSPPPRRPISPSPRHGHSLPVTRRPSPSPPRRRARSPSPRPRSIAPFSHLTSSSNTNHRRNESPHATFSYDTRDRSRPTSPPSRPESIMLVDETPSTSSVGRSGLSKSTTLLASNGDDILLAAVSPLAAAAVGRNGKPQPKVGDGYISDASDASSSSHDGRTPPPPLADPQAELSAALAALEALPAVAPLSAEEIARRKEEKEARAKEREARNEERRARSERARVEVRVARARERVAEQ